jgi:bifunctional non-homologous end joining protein LigD
MLASVTDAPLDDPQLVYEPKYDGIRAIAEVAPDTPVRLWSRLGNEKTRQFPEITAALQKWARRLEAPVVLDGEIVALDAKGEPTGFQQLQGRIHLTGARPSRPSGPSSLTRPSSASSPSRPSVAFIAFDLLRNGRTDLRDRPLLERRTELERVFGKTGSPLLRISAMVRGDGRALHEEAMDRGWEGLIAKRADSLYKSGKRTPDWRKIKIVHEQEFVIGGWTEPRHTRSHFGALLLGVYQGGALEYVGHTGTGFNEKELARLMKLLQSRETATPPFPVKPKTNERPHWVKPELVAQIKFTEWTADGKLRHPVYLGLRDDKKPEEVRREDSPRLPAASGARVRAGAGSARRPRSPDLTAASRLASNEVEALIDQLHAIEGARRDGVLTLPDGDTLKVTNLQKVFWPEQKLTKGDLFRYYVRVAPFICPAVADRPLVMNRYPNGIAAQPFYQHRVDNVPPGVRTEVVSVAARRAQIIGGSLKTLLYTTQLAAISQDPWFSRVDHPEDADHVALDLDPADGVPFARVLDVARWIHDELDALGAVGVPKTSGASGLHVYVPLPPGTPYEAGRLFCQIIATVVAQKHAGLATIERSVRARGRRVYVDYLQNIPGKTLASAYSARASDYAGVSTPLGWKEVDAGIDRREFTIESVPSRLGKVGDLWTPLRESAGIDLSRVQRYAEQTRGRRMKRPASASASRVRR